MLNHNHLVLQVKDKDVTIKRVVKLVVVVVVVMHKQVKHNQAKDKHKVVVDKVVVEDEGMDNPGNVNHNNKHLVNLVKIKHLVNLVNHGNPVLLGESSIIIIPFPSLPFYSNANFVMLCPTLQSLS